jgi:hypothetical protein
VFGEMMIHLFKWLNQEESNWAMIFEDNFKWK